MERSAWTDERLDDMAAREDSRFELLLTEIRELRVEMRTEMRDMRTELQSEVRELRGDMHGEFASVRRDMFNGAIALFAALAAMYGTMLVLALS